MSKSLVPTNHIITTPPPQAIHTVYAVYKAERMSMDKQVKNRGRYAGPARRVTTPTGTRSGIFQFNELGRKPGLKEPAYSPKNPSQYQVRAANSPLSRLCFGPTFGVRL